MAPAAQTPITSVALSPAGTHVAFATDTALLHAALPATESTALNAANLGQLTSALVSHVTCLAYGADGVLVADGRGGWARWVVAAAGLVKADGVEAAHGGEEVSGVAGGGGVVVTGGKDGVVRVWKGSVCVGKGVGHRYGVRSVDVCAEGVVVVSGGRDKSVRVWSVTSSGLDCLGVLTGHGGWVHCVRLVSGARGSEVVSCAGDKTVRVWGLEDMKEREVFRGHEYRVWGVDVSGDGAFALSGSTDATVRAWNLDASAEGERCVVLEGHRDSVLAVAVSRDGSKAVSGCEDGSLQLWDTSMLFGRSPLPAVREPPVVLEPASAPAMGDLIDLAPAAPQERQTGELLQHLAFAAVDASALAPGPESVQPVRVLESVPASTAESAPPPASPSTERRVSSEATDASASLKAAVSTSAKDLPDYDKSAAELVQALQRIQELERELHQTSSALRDRETYISELEAQAATKDQHVVQLQKQLTASENLAKAANVRALLAANPRKADETIDYEEPVNKISAVSDQLTALSARLDAMIAT